MRRKTLLLITLSFVLLAACNMVKPTPTQVSPSTPTPSTSTPSTSSPSTPSTPTPSITTPQVIDFELSDENIENYTTSSVYANDNGLKVVLKYDDETTRIANENEYSYSVYTALDVMIDKTMPFERAGNYVVKIFYNDLVKELDFSVKEEEKDGLISFSLSKEILNYDDDEIIDISDCTINATYRLEGEIVEKHFDYQEFEENSFVLALFDQENHEISYDVPLSEGSYILKATNQENEELESEVTIVVNKAKDFFSYRFLDINWNTNIEPWTSNVEGNSFSNYQGVQCTTKNKGSATSPFAFTKINKITITYSTTTQYGAGTIEIKVGDTLVGEVEISKSTNLTPVDFYPEKTTHGYVTFTVNCTENSVYIYGVDIDSADRIIYPSELIVDEAVSLYPEETHKINYQILPEETNIRNVNYSSNDINVATVAKDGTITAVGVGETDIVSSVIGKKNNITALTHVVVNPVLVTGLSILENDITVYLGSKKHIKTEILPRNASNKSLIYKPADENIVSVDEKGTIQGLALGNTTVEITTVDGGFSDILRVSVTEQPVYEKVTIEQNMTNYKKNNAYGLDYCPTFGNPKILIIPVWFNNSDNFIEYSKRENVRSDIQLTYFGDYDDIGWYSTSGYYYQESFGLCNLTGVVSPWYDINKSASSYGSEQADMSGLINNAVNWYFKSTGDDRQSFDTDKNGYLDGVVLIYAYPDSSLTGNYGNFWAYTSWLNNRASTDNPNTCAFFWASYDFMYSYGGVARSRTGISDYGRGDCHNTTVDPHTFIHEMGHVFGLNDYYDYSDYGYTMAGGFTMQDYNVGGHDPYSVMVYGWAHPYILNESCSIVIEPFQESHDFIILSPKWNEFNSPFDEYLIIELYSPTGLNELDSKYQYSGAYPQGPSTYGIRVWHVNAILAKIDYNQYGNYYISELTSNANLRDVLIAYNNSYSSSTGGLVDYHYSELRLIRNNTEIGYTTHSTLSASDLFYEGDEFSFETYSSQFYNKTSLDNGLQLGWRFVVEECNSEKAVISVIKQ